MKRIIYDRPGGILVSVPNEGARIASSITVDSIVYSGPVRADAFFQRWPVEGATVEWLENEENFLSRIASGVPGPYTIVDEIPSDRTYRNAWEIEGNIIVVDMEKARELKRAELRRLRDPLLVQADADYLRADETNDVAAKQLIVARKKKLRDVTNDPAIEAAKTPEALKAVMPEILK